MAAARLLAPLLLLLAAAASAAAAAAAAEDYSVEGQIRLPVAAQDPSQRRVVLNGGLRTAIPNAKGEFAFRGLEAGTYLLEVQDLENVFQALRVDVSARENGRVRATKVDSQERASYPLVLRAASPAAYFQVRVPYDWTAMLRNPMVLMMGFSVLLMFVMPRMMENMDPEELEAMRKGGISSVLQQPAQQQQGQVRQRRA